MNKKLLGMTAVAILWLVLAAWAWLRPADSFSDTERRPLAQFPAVESESVLKGKFMTDFESYALDQFPLRNAFRQLKARVHYGLLGQRDNNGIYLADGYAAKLEYPLNEDSVAHALQVFNKIREKYLEGSAVFLAVVPDKSYYLGRKNGYPVMDYEKMLQMLREGMPYASYVNLTDQLDATSYYKTDTHWRQESLLPAAQKLCSALGVTPPAAADYRQAQLSGSFYGVYYGQAALPMEPDTLTVLESDLLERCRVYNHETGKSGSIYDRSKLTGKDLYEVFLSGSVSLLTIENPDVQTDRELIIFRDSFGSSLAPLLVQGYKTVTLIDIRYLSSAMLSRFVDFHGQDVLFLYSTLVLNNSAALQ